MMSLDRTTLAREALARNPHWYHTIELAPGVVTPGRIDLRHVAPRLLPRDLRGRRALDVGTFDGFWAFELEARGAEVVAIDVETLDAAEWPPLNRARLEETMRDWELQLGKGFGLAAEVLGSSARRIPCDVYDLTPERIGGAVDVAFSGAILLHLRDPVRALERIHGGLRPGGRLVMFEPFSMMETARAPRRPAAFFGATSTNFTWWRPNISALRAWVRAAGFSRLRHRGIYRPEAAPRTRDWYYGFEATR